ncbi:MAG: hypothetical protein V4631_21945, partial [Pseudomonadota bacterium]
MKLTTTFNLLRSKGACTEGYRKLAKHLGGVEEYGAEKEINLLTILDSNGFDDAVWCLKATVQDADVVKRLIACDFAESVLHIFEAKRPGDDRPRKAIEAARGFAAGTVSIEDMRKARAAAAAAAAAAYAYAYAADADAAAAAAYAAADADAAAAAAYAAAYAAAAADADAAAAAAYAYAYAADADADAAAAAAYAAAYAAAAA